MKGKRQEKILEIIEKKIILTQEEIQAELNAMGYNVTQSTVSRDIKELRLIKGHDADGNYRYVSPASNTEYIKDTTSYIDIFAKAVKSVDCALNDIVIKCYNGMASSVCVAIDAILGDRMLGSVAGDDTVLLIMRSSEDAVQLTYELRKMM